MKTPWGHKIRNKVKRVLRYWLCVKSFHCMSKQPRKTRFSLLTWETITITIIVKLSIIWIPAEVTRTSQRVKVSAPLANIVKLVAIMVGSQIINLFNCIFQLYTLHLAALVCPLFLNSICSLGISAKQQLCLFIIQILYTKDFLFNVIVTQGNRP